MAEVSVVIPVFNGADTVASAIDSALAQRFDGSVEIVVVNDGSTDGTRDVLGGYGDRIRVTDQANAGPSAARNRAVRESQGRFLAFLDADDSWMSEKLARTVPILRDNPNIVLVYHDGIEVDSAGRVAKTSYYPGGRITPPSLEDLLSFSSPRELIASSSVVVIRRDIFDRCGGFCESLPSGEDKFLWLLARELGPFEFVSESLMRRGYEPSARREEWYVRGATILVRMIRERYGSKNHGDLLLHTLMWAGSEAMRRGDRSTAIRRYAAALRRNPLRARTYGAVAWALMPRRVGSAVARMVRPDLVGMTGAVGKS